MDVRTAVSFEAENLVVAGECIEEADNINVLVVWKEFHGYLPRPVSVHRSNRPSSRRYSRRPAGGIPANASSTQKRVFTLREIHMPRPRRAETPTMNADVFGPIVADPIFIYWGPVPSHRQLGPKATRKPDIFSDLMVCQGYYSFIESFPILSDLQNKRPALGDHPGGPWNSFLKRRAPVSAAGGLTPYAVVSLLSPREPPCRCRSSVSRSIRQVVPS